MRIIERNSAKVVQRALLGAPSPFLMLYPEETLKLVTIAALSMSGPMRGLVTDACRKLQSHKKRGSHGDEEVKQRIPDALHSRGSPSRGSL